MDMHNSRAPQRRAMALVRDLEATHNETGHPTVGYDALGREHRRRGWSSPLGQS
jgi:hypothetical protein